MKNMELLWEYQEAELALEKQKRELANTPTRKKLIQLKNVITASQKVLAEIENSSLVKQNLISELESKNRELVADIDDLAKDMGYYTECDDEELDQKEIEEFIKNCEKANEQAASVKKKLTSVKAELEENEKQIREQFARMKTAKLKYDELRARYDQEMKASGGATGEMEKAIAVLEQKLDPAVVKEYKRIKGIRQNPVAILNDNRCGGCMMQLPSKVTTDVAGSDAPVKCENCGRILILK